MKNAVFFFCVLLNYTILAAPKQTIDLTLESAVDIALNNSYRIKELEMEIEKTMFDLRARRAGLKSKVFLNLQTPDISRVSENKWNSTLYRDEIVRENTQRWQSELSISQPVILFGYPTNGYISLNYKMYRYQQRDNGNREVDFYNRMYLKYEQPFFTTNKLKNDLERAQLALQDNQLEYIDDRVRLIRDIGDDYYDVFELVFAETIFNKQLNILERTLEIAKQHAEKKISNEMERIQVELEITNETEDLLENNSNQRRKLANIKQRLRININDSLIIKPEIHVTPVTIKLNDALELGYENNPRLEQLNIYKRFSELDVDDQKGDNAFQVNLELTYGLEKKDERFKRIWDEYDNSNSATINAYIPLWDWGERKASIQAEMVDVRRRNLQIQEERENIQKNIINAFTNLQDYQARCQNLEKSLNISNKLLNMSIEQYEENQIALQDLMQIIERHKDIELNFMDTYIKYRRSLLELMINTYYDFEKSTSLLDVQFSLNY